MKKKKNDPNPRNERSSNEMEEGSRRAIGFHRCYLVFFFFFTGRKFRLARTRFRAIKAERHRGRAARGIFNYTLPSPLNPQRRWGFISMTRYTALSLPMHPTIEEACRLLINCHSARPSGAVGASRGNNRKNARPPTRHSMSGQVKSVSEYQSTNILGYFVKRSFLLFYFSLSGSRECDSCKNNTVVFVVWNRCSLN